MTSSKYPVFLGVPEDRVQEFMERDYELTYNADDNKLCFKVKVVNRPNIPERSYEFPYGQELEVSGMGGEKTLVSDGIHRK